MAQLFPKWTNNIPLYLGVGGIVFVLGTIGFIWYYFSPWYTDVGYRPIQPVPYSHKFHVGTLGMDCRYCHTGVEKSSVAMVPPTQTCMNCHLLAKASSPKLAALRESWNNKTPMNWIRIHKVPDFAYFDHSMHLRAGVGCESCHGNIAEMEVVELKKPLSMSWCLECHRDYDMHLRPQSEITKMGWTPPAGQREFAANVRRDLKLNPPTNCSGCHR